MLKALFLLVGSVYGHETVDDPVGEHENALVEGWHYLQDWFGVYGAIVFGIIFVLGVIYLIHWGLRQRHNN